MFQFIANIFGYLLEWLYNGIGQNYGIALILFTIILRIILLDCNLSTKIPYCL